MLGDMKVLSQHSSDGVAILVRVYAIQTYCLILQVHTGYIAEMKYRL
jgi:hypothetical protein